MRDRGDLLVAEEEGRRVPRRDILIGAGALTGAILLSACGSNESPVLDPTATVPGTDSSPNAEKSPELIIDEQAFNNWGYMTPKERELLALNFLDLNGVREPLPSYSTGAGSQRDVPELWRWLQRRGRLIHRVYEQNPKIAGHLMSTLITDQLDSPLNDMRVESPLSYFGMWKASAIGSYNRPAKNDRFKGFVAMCREVDKHARDVSGLSVECSFRKDAEGNEILWIDKAEKCFLGDDPSPAVQKFIVDNA